MRLYSKIRLSGSVAFFSMWLAAVSLSACANTVLVGEVCAAACEDDHPEGLERYNNVNLCACDGCSDACHQSVCFDHQTPDDACLPCVQESLRGDACMENSGLFQSGCLTEHDCAALVKCILACPQ